MVLVGRAWFGLGVRAVRVPGQVRRAAWRVVPAAGESGHGSWYFSLDLPRHVNGGRRRLLTVAGWLETWAETRARLRDSTRRIYRSHIRQHFRRLFDGVLLSELHVGHVERAFRRLFDEGMTPATARRLFSTLRTALNAAARERLIPDNPARYVKLPRGARPHAVVWTKRRAREWKQTGIRPAVAVWTPAQLAQFLSFIGPHRLFAVFHLIAMRGLRRGEACGLMWDDLDLEEGLAYIVRQVQEGPDGRLRACPLKTESSRRAVAFDPQTVTVLRAHRSWQSRWLSESGIPSQGWVFTDEIGRPPSPDCLTRTFSALVGESGLPPVRLHDLRHGPRR